MVALLDALRPLLSFLVTLLPAEKREGDSAVVRDKVEIFGRLFFVDRFLRILASIPTASVSCFLPLFCFFFCFQVFYTRDSSVLFHPYCASCRSGAVLCSDLFSLSSCIVLVDMGRFPAFHDD